MQPMPAKFRAISFLMVSLLLTAALLAAVAVLNTKVDPFQQYHLAPAESAFFPRSLQRYINPGLAKNADYGLVITGSSLMENYDLAEVNRMCSAKAINLAYSAMAAYETRKILEVALKHRAPKRVVTTLDFNSFSPLIDEGLPEIGQPLPLYLYDDARLNDFRYLLSGKVTMRSLAIAGGISKGLGRRDVNRAWSWDNEVTFNAKNTVSGIDPANINKRFGQRERNLAHMRASFEANIVPLIEQNPNTEFNFLFPPYSVLVWSDFVQRKQLDLSLEFKRYVFEKVGQKPNVRIYDFQWDAAITHNLDRYKDIYHYDVETNREMMHAVCEEGSASKRYRVTNQSLPSFLTTLRDQAIAADPAAIVAEALTK
jgi:hypothetical protein